MHNLLSSSGKFSLTRIKRSARSVVRVAGFELWLTAELPASASDIRHSDVFPNATHSPRVSDHEFQRSYEVTRSNALADRYRCHELWQLIAETAKLNTGDVIEVGVWRGGTGALVAKGVDRVVDETARRIPEYPICGTRPAIGWSGTRPRPETSQSPDSIRLTV